jgi:hypothetical protein
MALLHQARHVQGGEESLSINGGAPAGAIGSRSGLSLLGLDGLVDPMSLQVVCCRLAAVDAWHPDGSDSGGLYAHYALFLAFIHFHMSIAQLLVLLGFYYRYLAFYMCVGMRHFYD